jgi:hypothetical protein
MVLAYYTGYTVTEFISKLEEICKFKKLDGMELTNALTSVIDHYGFNEKPETGKLYRLGVTRWAEFLAKFPVTWPEIVEMRCTLRSDNDNRIDVSRQSNGIWVGT